MHTFEITIQRQSGDSFPVIAEEHRGGGQLPIRSESTLSLDQNELLALEIDAAAYGRLLGQALFSGAVRDAFIEALARDEELLRVLLFIEDVALRGLRWERLCAPFDQRWALLATSQRTPFSRYLPSLTDRRFPPIGRRDLRALIVAASPAAGNRFQLEPFDVAAAIDGVRAALGPIPSTLLADIAGADGRPTLDEICAQITAQPITLLHLVCHGRVLKDGESLVFLAGGAGPGTVDPVTGARLLERLGSLAGARGLPHFTFLSTCESASPDADEALGGLGQRLVRELGMPAVVAMTDKVSIVTANALSAAIYTRLREHGEPDRALVEGAVRLAERGDVMVPVLFSRLGGRPLFSDTLDRPLTPAELTAGLDALAQLIPERAPVLGDELQKQGAVLRRTLGRDLEKLSPEARQEWAQAMAAVETICTEAVELSFQGLCLGETPPAYDARCPFPGLRSFQSDARAFFFGREALVQKLLQRMAEQRFLAVLGPSGSGKSSAIFAGLVPALQRAEPDLQAVSFTPGEHPQAGLAAALANIAAGARAILVVDQFEEAFTLCQDADERKAFFEALLQLPQQHLVLITMRADFLGEVAPYPALRELVTTRQELVAPMTPEELRRAMELQAAAVGLRFEADLGGQILDDVRGEPGAMPLLQHALQELWQRRRGRWLRTAEYRAIGGIQQAIAHSADQIYAACPPEEKERLRGIFVRLTRLDSEEGEGQQRDTRQRVALAELVTAGADPAPTRALVGRLADARLLVTSNDLVEVAHEALIRGWPRLRAWLSEDRQGLLLREDIRQAARGWSAAGKKDGRLFRDDQLDSALALSRQPRFALNAEEQEFLDASLGLRAREAAEKEAARQRELQAAKDLADEQQRRADEARAAAGKLRQRALIAAAVAGIAFVAALAALGFYGQANIQQGRALANAENAQQQAATAEVARAEAVAQQQTAVAANSEAQAQRSTAVAEGQRADSNATEASQRALLSDAQAELERGNPEHALALAIVAITSGNPAPRAYFTLAEAADLSVRRVFALEAPVYAGAFSPDGSQAAGGNNQGLVRIWDVATGEQLRQASASGAINTMAFLPGRSGLLIAGEGGLEILDAIGTQPFSGGDGNPITVLTVAPDGSAVATGTKEGAVTIWDVAERSAITTFTMSDVGEDGVDDIAFSPEGMLYVLVDQSIYTIDPADSSELAVSQMIYTVGYDDQDDLSCTGYVMVAIPGTTDLIVGCVDGTILVWDVDTEQSLAFFVGHDQRIQSLDLSPDGRLLVSSSLDQTIRLWDILSTSEIRRYQGHSSEAYRVDFSPDGTRLLTAAYDGTLRLWDTLGGQLLDTYSGEQANPGYRSFVRFSADGASLSAAAGPEVATWSTVDGSWQAGVEEDGQIFALGPGGARALYWGVDEQSLQVLDTTTGDLISSLDRTIEAGVNLAAGFSADGRLLLTATFSEGAQLWDVDSGELLSTFELDDSGEDVNAQLDWEVAFSADGTKAAIGTSSSDNPVVRVWDVESGRLIARLPGHKDVVSSVAFSADGAQLISGSWDRTVKIWDLATQREIQSFAGHTSTVRSVALSRDGALLLTGSADKTVRLWDVETAQELARFSGMEGQASSVAFSPDGLSAAAGTDRDEVFLWRAVTSEDLVAWVQANRYIPQVGCEELARYLIACP